MSARAVSLFPALGHTWMVEATVESLVPVNVTRIALCPDPGLTVDDLSEGTETTITTTTSTAPQPPQPPADAPSGLRWNLDNFPAHLPRLCDVPGLLVEKSVLRRVFRVRAGARAGGGGVPARLGVLHVEWRTAQCEHGHVQQDVGCADAAAAPAAVAAGLDVAVHCAADRVALLEPFDAVCTVTNTSARTVALLVAYSETRELPPATVAALTAALAPGTPGTAAAVPDPTIATQQQAQQQAPQPCGMLLSGTPFSLQPVVLLPGAQHQHVLTLVPCQLGTCSLGSLLLYDTTTGAATPCPDIGSVFVAPPQQG